MSLGLPQRWRAGGTARRGVCAGNAVGNASARPRNTRANAAWCRCIIRHARNSIHRVVVAAGMDAHAVSRRTAHAVFHGCHRRCCGARYAVVILIIIILTAAVWACVKKEWCVHQGWRNHCLCKYFISRARFLPWPWQASLPIYWRFARWRRRFS